ncbi:hypothetical protein [Neobacillus cucumis]|nr:hypothetical protein [Neobacillus cucumis]
MKALPVRKTDVKDEGNLSFLVKNVEKLLADLATRKDRRSCHPLPSPTN